MLGNNFYHGIIAKSVTLFGNIFNDIKITRTTAQNKLQTITVPILYGNKDKYISLLAGRQEGEPRVQIELPRMSFAITNIAFDPERKNNPINKNIKLQDGSTVRTSFVEMPYNIDFELSVYTKSYIDSTQIVEQIAPFFTPDFNANIRLIPELDLDFDIKIRMTGMTPNIEYEGAFDNTRIIQWTVNFTMETFLVGPVNKEGLIRKADIGLFPSYESKEKILLTITPGLTPDGKPTSVPSESLPYYDINPDDPYGFIVERNVVDVIRSKEPRVEVIPPRVPRPGLPPIKPPTEEFEWGKIEW